METKYLWDIIDKLRDELNIASDGINDLNDVLKDLQAESIEQIKDNNKEREFSIATSIKNDKLKAEIKDEKYYSKEIEKKLKAEIKKLELLSCSDDCQDNVNSLIKLKAENKKLKSGTDAVENAYLKTELDKVKRCNKTMDGILVEREKENEELKHEIKHKAIKIHQDRIPKEYKKEAEEYFHHNPKGNKVWFFMFDEDMMEHMDDLYTSEDNAICVIKNLQNEKYCLNLPR